MKVLYLSTWYPTERDAMAGLFVQKHAQAVEAQGADVRVIHSDETGIRWYWDVLQQWHKLHQSWGLPNIVQLNVITKDGLLALWLKKRYHIPFIVVEHWSGYLPQNNSIKKGLHLQYTRCVARNASAILPVSNCLEKAMKAHGLKNDYWAKINNVVDDFFYEFKEAETHTKKRILHVSCFDEKAKNIQGMLRAVRDLALKRNDFELIIVGNGKDFEKDRAYADSLHFPENTIQFLGELPPRQVADWFNKCDFFLMFSNYENAPVVISESLATGHPIVSSAVGGIPEMVNESCGVLVTANDEKQLSRTLDKMLDHYTDYDSTIIRETGKQYSFESVGKKLVELYQEVIENNGR